MNNYFTDVHIHFTNLFNIFYIIIINQTAIENRISSDNVLSNLLTDDVLIELFLLHNRLHIIYHSQEKDIDEIIKYQTSILDWVSKLVFIIVNQTD